MSEALHAGRYKVASLQLDHSVQDLLSQRGIEQGKVIEVVYNNRRGTVLIEIGKLAVILDRTCTYRIHLLPMAAATPKPGAVKLPEPIPLRCAQADS